MTEHPELKDLYLKIADYLNTGTRSITARCEQITYTADELLIEFDDILTEL